VRIRSGAAREGRRDAGGGTLLGSNRRRKSKEGRRREGARGEGDKVVRKG